MRVSVATNGRAFSDRDFAKRMVESGVSGVNISIKGFSEFEYTEITKYPGCTEMISGYHNLCNLGIKPILSYLILQNDTSRINELLAFVTLHKMDRILFQFVKPVIEPNSKKIMSMNNMGNMVKYIYEKMTSSNVKYKIELSFPLCLIDKDVLENLILEHRITTCCHIQSGRGIVFDTDFKILPCNHFVGYPFSDIQAGKFGIEEVKNVWLSEEVEKFREKVNYYPSEQCQVCSKWDVCGGGCFTRWLFENPNDYITAIK